MKERPDILEHYLLVCCQLGASDLHLSEGSHPAYRVNGELRPDTSTLPVDHEVINGITEKLLDSRRKKILEEQRTIDTGYTSVKNIRFRINIYHQHGTKALAIRRLEDVSASIESLKLPPQLYELAELKDGLILFTGTTGSGKSTSLASIINEINNRRYCHIITIEDPVEFVHCNKKAMIHQREIGNDVPSYAHAIRAALREDPDVILLGEMRDVPTMHAALQAAETGHLVFSTLHTNDAVGVIDRLVGAFPGNEQTGVRQQLSRVLRAVVTQMLVKTVDGRGRVPVNEILIVDNAVANLIRNHKPEQIRSIMQSGRARGNQLLDHALAERVRERMISEDTASRLAHNSDHFREILYGLRQETQQRLSGTGQL
ncbi:MAG: PilT/PilU family type 4a pilus ATPase [Nitrospira sp.]|nr:PilT/PilU family type 4a pilus ATPase [bacterium]MBL7048316.1 PilT/PilU family type 4a pilus ATPase [Nitrospira sp.]